MQALHLEISRRSELVSKGLIKPRWLEHPIFWTTEIMLLADACLTEYDGQVLDWCIQRACERIDGPQFLLDIFKQVLVNLSQAL